MMWPFKICHQFTAKTHHERTAHLKAILCVGESLGALMFNPRSALLRWKLGSLPHLLLSWLCSSPHKLSGVGLPPADPLNQTEEGTHLKGLQQGARGSWVHVESLFSKPLKPNSWVVGSSHAPQLFPHRWGSSCKASYEAIGKLVIQICLTLSGSGCRSLSISLGHLTGGARTLTS